MKILIVEYFTGGGLCGRNTIAAGQFRREGEMMLRALAADLAEVEGVRLATTRDVRLPPWRLASVEEHAVAAEKDWTPRLRELLAAADAFWPIAPETGGILEKLCELGERGERLLLNSASEAVRLTASKRRTAEALGAAGVPCVATHNIENIGAAEAMNECESIVLKPDDGVGCEGVRIAAATCVRELARPGDVAQPLLEGEAASLNILYGSGEHRLVAVNRQEIERHADDDGEKFSLKACVVNGLRDNSYDWNGLARQIGQAIPGLAGHVGVDCIVRGGDVRVLEINPRLTISYAGLRYSLGANPAACVLALLNGASVPHFDLSTAAEARVDLCNRHSREDGNPVSKPGRSYTL